RGDAVGPRLDADARRHARRPAALGARPPEGHAPPRAGTRGVTLVPEAGMPRSALHTRICDLFGIRYPIVQTGMGWVSGARLTAATSAAGGMGILASATMTLARR